MAQHSTQNNPTAFISCSLRPEDEWFINIVEGILQNNGIIPTGTVGRYSAAPTNTAELMKTNIPLADMVVIVATPRYLQKDVQTGQVSYGLSETVHVEAGMAYMADKPVIVFVQEGTNVGNFLPNVTQYVVLNGQHQNLVEKWQIITSLLVNAAQIVQNNRSKKSKQVAGKIITGSLAFLGGLALIDLMSSENN